jgi:cell wall-associated NlpC family hydrolase
MRVRAARAGLAATLAAALVSGCAPTATPTLSPQASAPAPTAATPSNAAGSSTTATPVDPGDPGDPGAPTMDLNDPAARPGLNGVPDPAALPLPGPASSGPNLGDASYLQPTASLASLPSSPVMGYKFAGAKAALIQQELGLARQPGEPYRMQELNSAVVAAIKGYQAGHGLTVSGQVGKETWSKMFPDVSWEIDHWRTSPVLSVDATPNARIEQMITFIRSQVGAPYLWGGAGPKEYGYDCSGLMLQAMYSAGLDPAPINVVDHQRPDYPTTKKLYAYARFKHVPAGEAQRGDLVFYGHAGDPSSVTHVAMFLGNGFVLESITSLGVSEDHYYESFRSGAYTMRPDAVRLVG